MLEKKNKEETSVNDLLHQLNNKASLLYDFITIYNDFMNTPKDYGTGELINMVEVHTLTAIEENPGTNITQLAMEFNRTKGAISQTVTKLEKKGYVERVKGEGNAKVVLLYVTQRGLELSKAHKLYDIMDTTKTFELLMKKCTIGEIDNFYKVIERYIEILENEDTD